MAITDFFKPTHKKWILIGHASFLIMAILSVVFYKERILFADTSFQFFKLLNFEKVNIEAGRFGAILPQFPLLLAMKLGIGIKGLAIIFSFSFVLMYYLVFLVCIRFLKNITAGFIVLFSLILCISQSFFHPSTETHQALVYTALVFAILQYSGKSKHEIIKYSFAVAVSLVAFLAHPVSLYTLLFIVAYHIIDKKQFFNIKNYVLALLIIGMAIIKVLTTDSDSYEGHFFSQFTNFSEVLKGLSGAYSIKFFIIRIKSTYLIIVLLMIAVSMFLLYRRLYLKLLLFTVSTALFFMVSFITYHQGDATVMMERAFMPLALFISIPFFKEFVFDDKYGKMNVAPIFVIILLFFSFLRISNQGIEFKKRTRFSIELLKKTGKLPERKILISAQQLNSKIIAFWCYSFESFILSSIDKEIPVQTIFPAKNIEDYRKYEQSNNFFLGASWWLEWDIGKLNKKYFNLPNSPYVYFEIED